LNKRVFIRFSTLAALTALPAFIHAADQAPAGFKIERCTPKGSVSLVDAH